MPRLRLGLCFLAAVALAACRYPADPENTLDRTEGGTLRVGLLSDRATFDASPEAARLDVVADALGATLQFRQGGAHDLVAALEDGEIDLIAGGVPEDTPFASEIGVSKPWGRVQIGADSLPGVFGLRQGENAFLLAINRALAR